MSTFSLHITTPTTHLAWSYPNHTQSYREMLLNMLFQKKIHELRVRVYTLFFWGGFHGIPKHKPSFHHPAPSPDRKKNEAKRRMFQVVGSPRRAGSGSCDFCRRSQCHAGTELRTSIRGTASAVFMDLLI